MDTIRKLQQAGISIQEVGEMMQQLQQIQQMQQQQIQQMQQQQIQQMQQQSGMDLSTIPDYVSGTMDDYDETTVVRAKNGKLARIVVERNEAGELVRKFRFGTGGGQAKSKSAVASPMLKVPASMSNVCKGKIMADCAATPGCAWAGGKLKRCQRGSGKRHHDQYMAALAAGTAAAAPTPPRKLRAAAAAPAAGTVSRKIEGTGVRNTLAHSCKQLKAPACREAAMCTWVGGKTKRCQRAARGDVAQTATKKAGLLGSIRHGFELKSHQSQNGLNE